MAERLAVSSGGWGLTEALASWSSAVHCGAGTKALQPGCRTHTSGAVFLHSCLESAVPGSHPVGLTWFWYAGDLAFC